MINFEKTLCPIVHAKSLNQLIQHYTNTGVQSINNVYASVNKVENVLKNTYIFDLIDIGVYVVYSLYSRIAISANMKYFLTP